ncbi:uncharacterized protein LOC100381569 [Zea mays]|uniref:Uncharacterized protein n=1 Tax=Zea mays TaxID=4577 RepID=C0HH45_MAIZE|nr:uncharacterized protein LOC100381569 [Zea mays]ACN26348.1 unknown [Zea mays]|eukprot:NP_001167865.1 uncharacterized protein LOC100381569 [Zea mays]
METKHHMAGEGKERSDLRRRRPSPPSCIASNALSRPSRRPWPPCRRRRLSIPSEFRVHAPLRPWHHATSRGPYYRLHSRGRSATRTGRFACRRCCDSRDTCLHQQHVPNRLSVPGHRDTSFPKSLRWQQLCLPCSKYIAL